MSLLCLFPASILCLSYTVCGYENMFEACECLARHLLFLNQNWEKYCFCGQWNSDCVAIILLCRLAPYDTSRFVGNSTSQWGNLTCPLTTADNDQMTHKTIHILHIHSFCPQWCESVTSVLENRYSHETEKIVCRLFLLECPSQLFATDRVLYSYM